VHGERTNWNYCPYHKIDVPSSGSLERGIYQPALKGTCSGSPVIVETKPNPSKTLTRVG
jgi:hypothetical protein